MKTILITGCSSGYGLETARHFLDRGWRVIATMRRPRADLFPQAARLQLLPLDVTDPASIAAAVAQAGPVDVLVNNAGIGLAGTLEATPMAQVRQLFETNTFGVMAMMQAVIPGMRARGAGLIVNVTSSATLAPMPLVAVYSASKQAVEGLTASAALELAAVGITAKLVEPGHGPSTRFAENTTVAVMDLIPEAYAGFAGPVFEAFANPPLVTQETDVAQAVWQAATDGSARLRYAAGADAVALAA